MDENFLLQKRRVMELLALMKAAGKSWTFNVFSSANAIAKYTCEELVEIGVESIRDIPDDFPLNERQRRACTCV